MQDDSEFLSELRALLEKYDASIGFSVSSCSDTHGLSDERMVITRRKPFTLTEREVFSANGWTLDANDFRRR